MNQLKSLLDKSSKDANKTVWGSVSCRITAEAKSELIKLAASKGMNVNQYIINCISTVSENENRIINPYRYEDEYDDLLDKCLDLEAENERLNKLYGMN